MNNDPLLLRIIDGCKKSNIRSQELLYKKFYGFVMGVCLRYTGSKEIAEEILNDCFYKALKYINSYKALVPFEFWLKKIAINASIDHYRKSEKKSNLIILNDWHDADDTEPIQNLNFEDIMYLINQLNDTYRITFMLYEIDGYKHKEIAEFLDITEATSRSNLKRAKERLRELYVINFEKKHEKQVR